MTPEQRAEFDKLKKTQQTPAPMSIKQGEEMAARKAGKEVYEEMGAGEQFMVGVGKGLNQLYYGGKDLLGLSSPEDKQSLAALEAIEGGWGTAGDVTGNVLTLALPGGAIAKGATGLAKTAPKLALAAGLGGETALNAAYEGVKAPEVGETRLGNAGEAAAWTAGMGAVGPAFKGLANWRMMDEAKKLRDAGVRLTPGMGYKGDVATTVENFVGKIPFLGSSVDDMQHAATADWNKYVMQSIDDAVTKSGREGFKQLQGALTKSYDDVWSQVKPDSTDVKPLWNMLNNRGKLVSNLGADDAKRVGAALDDATDDIVRFMESGDPKILSRVDDKLRTLAGKSKEQTAKEAYKSVRDGVRKMLPKEVDSALSAVDTQYMKFKTFEDAAAYLNPQQRKSIFAPSDAQKAIKKAFPATQRTKGTAPLQEIVDVGTKTIGQADFNKGGITRTVAPFFLLGAGAYNPVGTAAAMATGRAAFSDPMRQMMVGGNAPESISALARALRAGVATN